MAYSDALADSALDSAERSARSRRAPGRRARLRWKRCWRRATLLPALDAWCLLKCILARASSFPADAIRRCGEIRASARNVPRSLAAATPTPSAAPSPSPTNSYQPELSEPRTLPERDRLQPDPESWESNLLFYAALADDVTSVRTN